MRTGRTYILLPATLRRDEVLLDTCSGSAIFASRNLNPRSSKRCLSDRRTISVLRPGASARIFFSAANRAAWRNVVASSNCSAASSFAGTSRSRVIRFSSCETLYRSSSAARRRIHCETPIASREGAQSTHVTLSGASGFAWPDSPARAHKTRALPGPPAVRRRGWNAAGCARVARR